MTTNISDFLLQRLSDAAPNANRPAVIEVITGQGVRPVPPRITLKDARNFMPLLLNGDSGAYGLIDASTWHVVSTLVLRRENKHGPS